MSKTIKNFMNELNSKINKTNDIDKYKEVLEESEKELFKLIKNQASIGEYLKLLEWGIGNIGFINKNLVDYYLGHSLNMVNNVIKSDKKDTLKHVELIIIYHKFYDKVTRQDKNVL